MSPATLTIDVVDLERVSRKKSQLPREEPEQKSFPTASRKKPKPFLRGQSKREHPSTAVSSSSFGSPRERLGAVQKKLLANYRWGANHDAAD